MASALHLQLVDRGQRSQFIAVAIQRASQGGAVKGEPAKVDASVAQIEWQQLEKAKQLPAFASIEKDEKHGPVLKILRSKDIPQLMELATIEQPKIKEKAYACRPSI